MKITGDRPINPGLLNHRLFFYRLEKSKDVIGDDVITPVLVAVVSGQVTALVGMELDRALARYARAQYRVVCWFFPNCHRELILIWQTGEGNTELDILDVRDVAGTRQRLELTCADHDAR